MLLSSSHHWPSHPLPNPPLLEARASGAAVLATATTPHATTATIAITTATSTSPLNLGSCLLFPAQASGCLLLGSAHPLGSTVRLRDPAQGRQTGLRTSVLQWRTGSGKRRYGPEPLPLACLLLPAALDPPVSFSAHLHSLPESLSLSLCHLSPSLPGHSALSCRSAAPMPLLSPPHRQETNLWLHPHLKVLWSSGSP